MATRVSEDRSHRSHKLNPRKHPRGVSDYDNKSKRKIWLSLKRHALLSEPEMRLLQDIPRILGSGDYANLGHARGASALLLADGLREHGHDGKVYSVDLFSKGNAVKRAIWLAKKFELVDRLELCKGSTIEWAEKLEDKRFKFVFVDADHSYEAVKRDFYDWSFLMEKGGLIAFHDTNQDFSHIALQDTVVGRWEEIKKLHVDRIRVFRKPL